MKNRKNRIIAVIAATVISGGTLAVAAGPAYLLHGKTPSHSSAYLLHGKANKVEWGTEASSAYLLHGKAQIYGDGVVASGKSPAYLLHG